MTTALIDAASGESPSAQRPLSAWPLPLLVAFPAGSVLESRRRGRGPGPRPQLSWVIAPAERQSG